MSLPHGETFLRRMLRKEVIEPTHSHEVGKIVPVLEHTGCRETKGKVQEGGTIICIKCGKSAMLDNREFANQGSIAK